MKRNLNLRNKFRDTNPMQGQSYEPVTDDTGEVKEPEVVGLDGCTISTTGSIKFDPKKEMQRLIDADTEPEDAKAFVNSRIRFFKGLSSSKLLKTAFKSRGVDIDYWDTLEELA